jgi:cytochrome c oxidase cbb3-type subunit 3
MLAMFISVISVIVYVLYYPSIPWFGEHSKGYANWTQIDEMRESVAELEAYRTKKFAKIEQDIEQKTLQEINADDELKTYAIKTAKVLFGDNCAACHGAAGQGNAGFPVLADDNWLYGGSLDNIFYTIKHGRKGNMPAKMAGITTAEAEKLADFLIKTTNGDTNLDPTAKALYFSKACVACHGADMRGNKMLGSANLVDKIYRFKAADQHQSLVHTIMVGVNQPSSESRSAVMPAFMNSNVISTAQIKKLAIYVHALGGGK